MKIKLMWQVVLFIAVFVGAPQAYAQKQEVRYKNERQKVVNKEEAAFYEIIKVNTDGLAEVSRYTIDSILVGKSSYSDFEKNRDGVWIRHGTWQEWHRNGQLVNEGQYSNNKANGTFTSWFENGQLQYKSFYKQGVLQDTLYGYYEDGTLRRIETYLAGKMLKGEVYAPDGTSQAFYPYQERPQFPGGEQALMKYISNNVKYPKHALRAGVGGIVVIRFMVEKDGTISHPEVARQVHPDADAEALRVVRSMPKWEPGKQEGEVVAMEYYLPVRFAVR